MQREEEEVGVIADVGERGAAEEDECCYCDEAEDDGLGAETVEEVGLDVEIYVEGGVAGEEDDEDAAEVTVVGV